MEANDASLGSGDATSRAQELRASLGARQDAESLLADASRIRLEAAASADALVEEAQTLSVQLVRESRETADELTREARERADGILARARQEAEELADRARATGDAIRAKAEADVEEHRRRVRAEVTEQVTRDLTDYHEREVAAAREQSDALVSDLEASARILGVSLEAALGNISQLIATVEGLRSTPSDAARTHGRRVSDFLEPAPPTEPLTDPPTEQSTELLTETTSHETPSDPTYDVGNPPPASSVPSAASQFRVEPDEPPSAERPRSATEAFLTSSSLEVEQSGRELRDLQHPEEARRKRGEESRQAAERRELEEGFDDDDPEPAEAARPLGWLFRTAQ